MKWITKNEELAGTLDKLFKKLDVPKSSKILPVLGYEVNSSDCNKSTITKNENQFNKLNFKQPNLTSLSKNWYSKPTPSNFQRKKFR